MTLQSLQRCIVFIFAICMALLVITGLLSVWEVIGEKYFEKSMWSILVISIGMISVLIAVKIVEIKEIVRR
ncbi:MAG: hypothetical protein V1876_00900 [Candidatus Peregrinibacteria bacterium]